jgi:hypothetical protein
MKAIRTSIRKAILRDAPAPARRPIPRTTTVHRTITIPTDGLRSEEWPGYVAPVVPIGAPPRPIPPAPALRAPVGTRDERPGQPATGDPHLRSVRKVTGYYIRANDDDIGHVEEFLVEDESWVIMSVSPFRFSTKNHRAPALNSPYVFEDAN